MPSWVVRDEVHGRYEKVWKKELETEEWRERHSVLFLRQLSVLH